MDIIQLDTTNNQFFATRDEYLIKFSDMDNLHPSWSEMALNTLPEFDKVLSSISIKQISHKVVMHSTKEEPTQLTPTNIAYSSRDYKLCCTDSSQACKGGFCHLNMTTIILSHTKL